LMRPCARGPGASAMGGAGVGDGERELGSVAEGMMGYECCAMYDGRKPRVARDLVVLEATGTWHASPCVYWITR